MIRSYVCTYVCRCNGCTGHPGKTCTRLSASLELNQYYRGNPEIYQAVLARDGCRRMGDNQAKLVTKTVIARTGRNIVNALCRRGQMRNAQRERPCMHEHCRCGTTWRTTFAVPPWVRRNLKTTTTKVTLSLPLRTFTVVDTRHRRNALDGRIIATLSLASSGCVGCCLLQQKKKVPLKTVTEFWQNFTHRLPTDLRVCLLGAVMACVQEARWIRKKLKG